MGSARPTARAMSTEAGLSKKLITQKVLKIGTPLWVRTLPLAMGTRSHFFPLALPPSVGDVRYPSGRMPGAKKREPAGWSFSQATIWSLELVSSMHGSLVILNCNLVDLLVQIRSVCNGRRAS